MPEASYVSTSLSESPSTYENIILERPAKAIGRITLNRPKVLNALSPHLFKELNHALVQLEEDLEIAVIVITGSDKVFAAGADIGAMKDLSFPAIYSSKFTDIWTKTIISITKPIIAAVGGYALGGGCEIAMMADILYCTTNATFGQPEIKLGVIPGAGGTQRLIRSIGKARAMDIILTGRTFTGSEAEAWGLAARTFPSFEDLMEGTMTTANTIANYSRLTVRAAKETVNQSQEVGLTEGLKFERHMFHALFGSQDQKIGMDAFSNKTKNVEWVHM
ncbi:hypothetical protein ABW21_db0206255 [Orbilia brochopaga]|nr:hypothetical protein ABW21_db0206255 [Drechslerella brochopaga]